MPSRFLRHKKEKNRLGKAGSLPGLADARRVPMPQQRSRRPHASLYAPHRLSASRHGCGTLRPAAQSSRRFFFTYTVSATVSAMPTTVRTATTAVRFRYTNARRPLSSAAGVCCRAVSFFCTRNPCFPDPAVSCPSSDRRAETACMFKEQETDGGSCPCVAQEPAAAARSSNPSSAEGFL